MLFSLHLLFEFRFPFLIQQKKFLVILYDLQFFSNGVSLLLGRLLQVQNLLFLQIVEVILLLLLVKRPISLHLLVVLYISHPGHDRPLVHVRRDADVVLPAAARRVAGAGRDRWRHHRHRAKRRRRPARRHQAHRIVLILVAFQGAAYKSLVILQVIYLAAQLARRDDVVPVHGQRVRLLVAEVLAADVPLPHRDLVLVYCLDVRELDRGRRYDLVDLDTRAAIW